MSCKYFPCRVNYITGKEAFQPLDFMKDQKGLDLIGTELVSNLCLLIKPYKTVF